MRAGSPIALESSRQLFVAFSSAEAELISLLRSSSRSGWMFLILRQSGVYFCYMGVPLLGDPAICGFGPQHCRNVWNQAIGP